MNAEILPNLLWQCGIDELPALIASTKPDAIVCMVPRSEFFEGERTFAQAARTYVRWPIEDGDLPDLQMLEGLVLFVTGLITTGQRTIVHCAQGLNRSGLVVSRVVSTYEGWTGAKATKWVRARRPLALCNKNFAEYVAGKA